MIGSVGLAVRYVWVGWALDDLMFDYLRGVQQKIKRVWDWLARFEGVVSTVGCGMQQRGRRVRDWFVGVWMLVLWCWSVLVTTCNKKSAWVLFV